MRALFAAGCFWGVQKIFDETPGVLSTTVGFSGGHSQNPTYKEVCDGNTGHAEAIEIFFDPEKVSYFHLLDVFWNYYHPQLKPQNAPDNEWQYRSVVFYYDEEQKHQALEAKNRHEQKFGFTLATQIIPAMPFFAADDYHQKYYLNHGAGSC